MIAELRVRDFATISDVTLHLGPGLNVLTGETGAGKSMLVDALGLLLGGRAATDAVRPGAGKGIVEGALEGLSVELSRRVEALGLDVEEGRLVIRREVAIEGRSRAWVNGSPTTAAVLAELGALLVDIHGQHDAQSLLRAEAQRDILDAFAQAEGDRAAVVESYGAVASLRREEEALIARRDEVQRRADYLRHMVAEIDQAEWQPGEEEALALESARLSHAGQLEELARAVTEALDGEEQSALIALHAADRALQGLERVDPTLSAWREMLDSAYANVGEVARLAAEYAAGIEQDGDRLDAVERRREVLGRLSRKHGGTAEAVRAVRETAAAELDLLDTADTDLRALSARRTAAEAALTTAAAALTARRQHAAGRLERGVNRLLPKLGLAGGKVHLEFRALEAVGPAGAESVVFLARLNVGLEAKALARVASGGELSRLMLALKVVLARHDAIPTLIFDEVDAGVGGEVGAQLAEALGEVARRHQVLVITHLPQIAARADRHLVVSKTAREGIATSDVAQIHGEDRITELARMLGDPDGDAARRHAAAMLGTVAR